MVVCLTCRILCRTAAIGLSPLLPMACRHAGTGSPLESGRAPGAEFRFESITDNLTPDSAGSGGTAGVHGASAITTPFGKALLFSGRDSYVDCGRTPAQELTSGVSIECWVRPDALPEGEVGIAGRGRVEDERWQVERSACGLTFYRNGNVYWYIADGANHVSCGLGLGVWQHVVGTYDGQAMRLYVNGAQVGFKYLNVPIPVGGSLFIGATGPKSGVFTGGIGGVRIYDYALSADMVQSRFGGMSAAVREKPERAKGGRELAGDGYTLRVGDNGAMQVSVGGDWYALRSHVSHPGEFIGWNSLGGTRDTAESAWALKLAKGAERDVVLTAAGAHYALRPGQSHTFRWAVYPQASGADYWAFVNRVRRDWKVNTRLIGPWAWWSLSSPTVQARVRDPQALRAYLERNRAQVVATMWLDYDNFNVMTGKPATRAETKALMQEAYKAIKAVNPEIKVVGCIECNWVTLPDEVAAPLLATLQGKPAGNFPCTDAQMEILKHHTLRWQDCLLVTRQGRHLLELYYRGLDRLPMLAIAVCPAPGNSQHAYWLDQARFLMEEVGLDGLYIDQFNLAFSDLQRYSYDRWDGVTADLDAATGRIARQYTDGAWVSIGAQKSLADCVLGKGSYMVANTFPTDPVMQAAGIHRFHEMEWGVDPRTWADGEEPPLMNPLCKGHLTTPIGLGYRPNFRGNRPEERENYAHTIMKAVIAYLRHGVLYYPYASEIPETGPGAGENGPINEMFPITPVELHKGWVLGEERLVTAVSGTFPWRKERRPDALAFDLTGRPVPADADIARAPSGWTVTLRLPDWQSIAVVR